MGSLKHPKSGAKTSYMFKSKCLNLLISCKLWKSEGKNMKSRKQTTASRKLLHALPPPPPNAVLNHNKHFASLHTPAIKPGLCINVWSLNVASSLMEVTMVYYCQCNCRYLTFPLQVHNCEYDLRGFKKLLMYWRWPPLLLDWTVSTICLFLLGTLFSMI